MVPPADRAPRQAASMTPPSPPQTRTAPPRRSAGPPASAAPHSAAVARPAPMTAMWTARFRHSHRNVSTAAAGARPAQSTSTSQAHPGTPPAGRPQGVVQAPGPGRRRAGPWPPPPAIPATSTAGPASRSPGEEAATARWPRPGSPRPAAPRPGRDRGRRTRPWPAGRPPPPPRPRRPSGASRGPATPATRTTAWRTSTTTTAPILAPSSDGRPSGVAPSRFSTP